MWTTKRLLLLLTGFGLFVACYLVYAFYLGGIDGLPPLAEGYGPRESGQAGPSIIFTPPHTDQKLDMAFGDDDTRKMPIKLEVNSKNLVLASENFDVLPDGRVRLTPFLLAIFGKNTPQGKFPEINTIKGDVAYLTFDQPVNNIAEIGKRKITAGELTGKIYIKNNRRTATQDDDLSLTTPGPMYYREDQHLIWTMAPVRMLDTQSKPEPTTITADGLDLVLTADKPETPGKPAPAPATAKKDKPTVGGVETITLRANVEMHLIDTNSGFLGGADKPKATDKKSVAKADDANADKPKVVITTPGPFRYDVATDRARFDVPAKRGPLPEKVTVTRLSGPPGKEKHDYLYCEHLELQFQRKADASPTPAPAPAPAAGDSPVQNSMDLSIQDAHATGREVELISEAEGLHAIGNDFFYDARTKVSILKGTPEMVALKDGNEIHCPMLHMVNVGDKDAQQVKAMGKGYVSILDKASSWKRSQYAHWDESANFSKEGDFDCLTLTGKGRFEDREHHQVLGADRLKVWLMPGTKETDKAANNEPQKMRPHHLEGEGHVIANSDDLIIEEPTEHLYVWFRDTPMNPTADVTVPAPGPAFAEMPAGQASMPMGERAAAAPPPMSNPEPVAAADDTHVAGKPAAGQPPRPLNQGVGQAPLPTGAATAAKKPPLRLSARSVEAFINRTAEKNDLEKIRCDGHVVVLQAPQNPEDPNDKGVDIRGDKLTLDNAPEGGILLVTGNMAVVQLSKITISGDEVNINQRTNQAWVPCRGWMKMLSTAALTDGATKPEPKPTSAAKTPEKASELTIYWKKDMQFDGRHAVFQGDIQAEQEASRLLCQEMQVFLDNPVSLKEGQKGSQPAKVKELVCDKSVRMDEAVNDKDGKLVRKSRLMAPVVAVNNEDGEMNAPGPGVVYLLQYGSSDDTGLGPKAPTPPARPAGEKTPPKTELKLTRINYLDRLYSNNIKRTATFYGSVEVINLPTDNIDQVVDVDKPPKGCLYLRCEQLKVFSHKLPDGRTTQEMDAMKHVVVQSQEFWGVAEKVTFDESKDLVIMEGGDGGKATLYRDRVKGGNGDKLRGKKIWYWRKTNEFKIEGGDAIDVR